MANKKVDSEAPFLKALRVHFPVGRYLLISQVDIPLEGGFRRADALVIGKWKAFDASIQGFEIKASRADWQLELKKPAKAEGSSTYCDGWSLLTYPGVAMPEEIPPNWGHYVLDGTIKELKSPTLLSPKPFDRVFLPHLMDALQRNIALNVEIISSEAEYQRGFADGKKEGYVKAEAASGYLTERLALAVRKQDEALLDLRRLGIDPEDTGQIQAILQISSAVRKWGPAGTKDVLDLLSFLKENRPGILLSRFKAIGREAEKLGIEASNGIEKLNSLFGNAPENGPK